MAHPLRLALIPLALAACGDPEIFDRVAGPVSIEAQAAQDPRLADTPTPPPPGVYTEDAPDPARGEAVQIDLAAQAEAQERRRIEVSGPVR